MRFLAPLWGLTGVFLLLGFAVYRLSGRAFEAIASGLSGWQWALLILWTLFMAFGEGYRGFQKKFSPRTAARSRYLRDHPNLLHTLLAPPFCMGYFHATRRVQLTSIGLTLGIVFLVLLVSLTPQPWRGIIDFGVVLGLTWGIISLVAHAWQAHACDHFPHSPEVPEQK